MRPNDFAEFLVALLHLINGNDYFVGYRSYGWIFYRVSGANGTQLDSWDVDR